MRAKSYRYCIYNKVKIFTRFLKLDSDSSGKLSLHELLSLPELRNNPLVRRVTGRSANDNNNKWSFYLIMNASIKYFGS